MFSVMWKTLAFNNEKWIILQAERLWGIRGLKSILGNSPEIAITILQCALSSSLGPNFS
jgi:hypothetical protein